MSQPQTIATSRGPLMFGEWGAQQSGIPVLAVHGITSSHLAWQFLAQALPGRRLIAPDLRGRGGSPANPNSGMAAHADDLAGLLDALAVESVDLVGHSMGAFVSLVFADRHPDRVRTLVLVDGGLPLTGGGDQSPADPAAVEQAVLAPLKARLSVVFASRQAAQDAWQAHPAFADDWAPEVADYVDYDLRTREDVAACAPLTSRVDLTTIEQDSLDMMRKDDVPQALSRRTQPAVWLTAPRGLQNEVPPLYPADAVDHWRSTYEWLDHREVPDVNHYTIVMSSRGAQAIARELIA